MNSDKTLGCAWLSNSSGVNFWNILQVWLYHWVWNLVCQLHKSNSLLPIRMDVNEMMRKFIFCTKSPWFCPIEEASTVLDRPRFTKRKSFLVGMTTLIQTLSHYWFRLCERGNIHTGRWRTPLHVEGYSTKTLDYFLLASRIVCSGVASMEASKCFQCITTSWAKMLQILGLFGSE